MNAFFLGQKYYLNKVKSKIKGGIGLKITCQHSWIEIFIYKKNYNDVNKN